MKRLFIDTETTGTDPRRNAVTQIALLVEVGGVVTREWECKLRPWDGAIIEAEALAITGKTADEVMAYPDYRAGYKEFISVLGGYVDRYKKDDKFFAWGWNVGFDMEMMHQLAAKCGDKFLMSFIVWPGCCVAQQIARRHPQLWLSLKSRKLGAVAEALGVKFDGDLHDALTDIRLTRAIWEHVNG